MNQTAALGFTVKSGWAAAVLLAGPLKPIGVIDSRRIELSDPAIPDSRQPYHAGFGTARVEGEELARLLRSVRQFGKHSVESLIRQYKASRNELAGAGIVVGSLADPESIRNDHIRIHALEGRLFRGVVEEAAVASGLSCSLWRERDLYAAAVTALQKPEDQIRAEVASLGSGVAGPWRAEQKMAALAAWLQMA